MNNRNSYLFLQLRSLLMMTTVILLVSCSIHDNEKSFKTADEAISACRQELATTKKIKNARLETLADIIVKWHNLKDSTTITILRDSSEHDRREIVDAFFNVTDSFKIEIERLMGQQNMSLKNLVKLKMLTAENRGKVIETELYKTVSDFYTKMDEQPTFTSLDETKEKYKKLLQETTEFKSEKELYSFIQKEDVCFRSLMSHLNEMDSETMAELSDKTDKLFNTLYHSAMENADDERGNRVLTYLTMRLNRRILQNAETCQKIIEEKKPILESQAVSYRWMLMQPYMTLDGKLLATLTSEQEEQLYQLAEKLPALLATLEGRDYSKSTVKEKEYLKKLLTNYFVKAFLMSVI